MAELNIVFNNNYSVVQQKTSVEANIVQDCMTITEVSY